MGRGAFIVVEGLDRSGKSTQTSTLHDHLVSLGGSVKLYKFPDRTTATGKMIDSYLRSQSDLDDRAIHLLFSANRWEAAFPHTDNIFNRTRLVGFRETMIKELEAGTTIICDRYAFSGIAFSTAKSLPPSSSSSPQTISVSSSSTLTYEWCRAPDRSLPAPDLVVFLDITPEAQAARGGYGQERYEKADLQRRVREVFRRIAGEFITQPQEVERADGVRWVEVDAGRDLKSVWTDVWAAVEPYTRRSKDSSLSPIGRLWEDAS